MRTCLMILDSWNATSLWFDANTLSSEGVLVTSMGTSTLLCCSLIESTLHQTISFMMEHLENQGMDLIARLEDGGILLAWDKSGYSDLEEFVNVTKLVPSWTHDSVQVRLLFSWKSRFVNGWNSWPSHSKVDLLTGIVGNLMNPRNYGENIPFLLGNSARYSNIHVAATYIRWRRLQSKRWLQCLPLQTKWIRFWVSSQ